MSPLPKEEREEISSAPKMEDSAVNHLSTDIKQHNHNLSESQLHSEPPGLPVQCPMPQLLLTAHLPLKLTQRFLYANAQNILSPWPRVPLLLWEHGLDSRVTSWNTEWLHLSTLWNPGWRLVKIPKKTSPAACQRSNITQRSGANVWQQEVTMLGPSPVARGRKQWWHGRSSSSDVCAVHTRMAAEVYLPWWCTSRWRLSAQTAWLYKWEKNIQTIYPTERTLVILRQSIWQEWLTQDTEVSIQPANLTNTIISDKGG